MSEDSLESAVFRHFIFRLPGLQRHFLDDPSDTEFGYSHCLSIANNWNPKKLPLVASRLDQWKAVLGTEEQPKWYIPTRHTIPRMCVPRATSLVSTIDLTSTCCQLIVFFRSNVSHLCYGITA